jgi:hypothetical protein
MTSRDGLGPGCLAWRTNIPGGAYFDEDGWFGDKALCKCDKSLRYVWYTSSPELG